MYQRYAVISLWEKTSLSLFLSTGNIIKVANIFEMMLKIGKDKEEQEEKGNERKECILIKSKAKRWASH